VTDVVERQMPAVRGDVRYDLGCLYIGVNDVRSVEWDGGAFDAGFRPALAFLGERCDRVLTLTAPLDLGRPRAGAKVGELNTIVTSAASDMGALLLDLSSFGARNLVMADHVHPTAFGQIAMAERALDVLAADGLRPVVRPSSLIQWETTRWKRLRGDATYAYRHTKVSARSAWLKLLA
jgi:hypothetical protein